MLITSRNIQKEKFVKLSCYIGIELAKTFDL